MAKRKSKRSRRHGFGLTPIEHAEEAKKWFASASKIVSTADRVAKRNQCGAIEHYTDAIAEGTVASVQARQAMETKTESAADALVRRATRSQRTAVRFCRLS